MNDGVGSDDGVVVVRDGRDSAEREKHLVLRRREVAC